VEVLPIGHWLLATFAHWQHSSLLSDLEGGDITLFTNAPRGVSEAIRDIVFDAVLCLLVGVICDLTINILMFLEINFAK
jgi:hypothetical protein